jgi:hypothetical protein
MGGLPLELITMLGSGLLSGVMTIWSQSQKAKQDAFKRAIDGLAAQSEATDLARRYENKGFQITRRIIALAAVASIIVWPKVVAVFWPDVGVTVGYTQWNPGFLFITEGTEKLLNGKHLKGLVLTPLDTHLLSAIIGMYFGASIVKNAK